MAPISLLEAYSGGLGDDAYYQQQDPFFQGGRAVLGMQAQPTTNAEAIWGPLIQGLIGGGLAGYGKKRAADAAFADYSANPLLDALSTSRQPSEQEMGLRTIQAALGDPLATGLVGLPAQDPIHNYLATERPKGWTAKTGKSDLLMAALQADTTRARLERRQELQDKVDLEYGPEARKAKTELAREEMIAKTTGEIQAKKDAYGPRDPNDVLPQDPEQRGKAAIDLENTVYNRIVRSDPATQFIDIKNNFETLLTLRGNTDAIAAPSAITTFARILDPGSTVREGDYNTVSKNAQSVLDKLQGDWRKAMEGTTPLKPEALEAMIKIAAEKHNAFGANYAKIRGDQYAALKMQGGSPDRIPTLEYRPYKYDGGTPKEDPSVGDVATGAKMPPPGLSFEQFKAWKRENY